MKHLNRYALTLTSAALLCGTVAAQERGPTTSTQHSVAQARPLKTGDVQASDLIGAAVKSASGESIGEVEDLIVTSAANVTSAVISTGGVLGVGAKKVAIPYKELSIAPDGHALFLNLTEEELQARPAFDADDIDDRAATSRTVAPAPTPAPARSANATSDRPAAPAAQANAQHEPKAEVARTLKASEQPAKSLIGATVVDSQDSRIGKIQDLIVSAGRQGVQAILSVGGGAAGFNSRMVAVPLDELTIKRDADEDRRHEPDRVQTRLTVAQLESLPEFRYE
jgi:sporulation protein YlmC with PRC-barrel domain